MTFFNYKSLKLELRVILASHTVALLTFGATKTTCSPMIGDVFDTMIVASMDNQRLSEPARG